jgi:hypothetical protein
MTKEEAGLAQALVNTLTPEYSGKAAVGGLVFGVFGVDRWFKTFSGYSLLFKVLLAIISGIIYSLLANELSQSKPRLRFESQSITR